MLFKGSNNLVQIYRSFSITGNYGRRYFLLHADVNIHASNRQIWYRHPNSEAGNDEIQNVQRWIFILWELHSKILVGDKNFYNNGQKERLCLIIDKCRRQKLCKRAQKISAAAP